MLVKDFISQSRPRGWLVEGLLPQGHVILVGGLPGTCKSWLLEALAVHIASGKPFLGLSVMQGAVILIDEDTPSDELNSRLVRLATGLNVALEDLPIHIHSFEGFRLDDEQSLLRLENEVTQFKPVLIELDCLGKVMGKFDENSAKDANKAGTAWNRLKAGGATVMLSHHLNKREGNITTDFTKLSRGSVALVANSDTAFGVELVNDNPTSFNVYPVERRRKLGIREPFAIKLNEDGKLTWASLERTKFIKPLGEVAKAIVPLFVQDKDKLTVNEVRKKLAGFASEHDIRQALGELTEAKLLRRGTQAHNRYIYEANPEIFGY